MAIGWYISNEHNEIFQGMPQDQLISKSLIEIVNNTVKQNWYSMQMWCAVDHGEVSPSHTS